MPGPGPAGKAPATTPARAVEAPARAARPAVAPLRRLGEALGNRAAAELLARQAISQSPGRPLAAGVRAGLEDRFGADLGSVRVHDDPAAAADVGAVAYTVGEHIVLGREGGQGVLAHEIAHVLQQRDDAGGSAPARLEGEAGRAARSGDAPVTVRERGRVGLARQEAPAQEAPATQAVETAITVKPLDDKTVVSIGGVAAFEYRSSDPAGVNWQVKVEGGQVNIAVQRDAATDFQPNMDGLDVLRRRGYTVNVFIKVTGADAPRGEQWLTLPAGSSASPPRPATGTKRPAGRSAAKKPPAKSSPASKPGAAPTTPDVILPVPDQAAAGTPALSPPVADSSWLTAALGPAATGGLQPGAPSSAPPVPGPTGPEPAGPAAPAPAASLPSVSGQALVEQFSDWSSLDEEGLGARLAQYARAGTFGVVGDALDKVGFTDRDDVALALVSGMTDADLDEMTRAPFGRALNLRLRRELRSGWVGQDEQAQVERLRKARDRAVAAVSRDARTDAQAMDEIKRQTGMSYHDLILALGGGPIDLSPLQMEAALYAGGVMKQDDDSGDADDVDVIDTVWTPDPYHEGRFIEIARVGRASRIDALKQAGQEEVRASVLNGLLLGLSGLPGRSFNRPVPPERAPYTERPGPVAGRNAVPEPAQPAHAELPLRQFDIRGQAANDNAVESVRMAAGAEELSIDTRASLGGGTRTPPTTEGAAAPSGRQGARVSQRPVSQPAATPRPATQPQVPGAARRPGYSRKEILELIGEETNPAGLNYSARLEGERLRERDALQPAHLPKGTTQEQFEALAQQARLRSTWPEAQVRKGTLWRPTAKDIQSILFQIIVGTPEYTDGGLLKGVIPDASVSNVPEPYSMEIKFGGSSLDFSYQLRLMVYRSIVKGEPLVLITARPPAIPFQKWLRAWGVDIRRPETRQSDW